MAGSGMQRVFADREEAGRELADRLGRYAGRDDVVVLALPRGGVPVAREVADALDAPLDVLVVRKLGLPAQPELALGAVASGGVRILNRELVDSLGLAEEELEELTERERVEVARREDAYRGGRGPTPVEGRTVILVDDGVATGATLRAAVRSLRKRGPSRIVAAVPVAPPDSAETLREEVDELVCVQTPPGFFAVGQFYAHFPQVPGEQVREMLEREAAGS